MPKADVLRISSFALLLFSLTLGLRLYDVASPAPQPDEIHWQSRSYKIIKRFRAGHGAYFSKHLGHPGVPPAIFMASGQWLVEKWNLSKGIEFGDPGYIDRLTAARIANAIVSSLLPPILFLGLLRFLGLFPSFLVGMLLLFDPLHLALSREAHLDSQLALFSCLSCLTYFHAVARQKEWLKLPAGVFWGLAIATKPTAASLAIVFLVVTLIEWWRAGRKRAPITPFDLWAVFIGHLVLAGLCTRFWYHKNAYLDRLRIKSNLADALFSYGSAYQGLLPLALIVLGVMVWQVLRRKKLWIQYLLVAWSLLTFILTFPQVSENIVRFWGWAIGLGDAKHVSYGHIWTPQDYGYLTLLGSRLPSLIVISALFGCFCRPRIPALTAILFVSIWILPLSVSDKQTIRYALPIFAAIYVLSGLGISTVFTFLRWNTRSLKVGLSLCCIVVASLTTLRWHPDYHAFSNLLFGGVQGAVNRSQHLGFVGQNEIVHFLHSLPEESHVTVLGDSDTLEYAYRRLYPGENTRVHLRNARVINPGGLLVHYPTMGDLGMPGRELLAQGQSLFDFQISGVTLSSVKKIPIPDYSIPYTVPISRLSRTTGSVDYRKGGEGILHLRPDKERKGFVFYGEVFGFRPGSYTLEVDASPQADLPKELAPDRYAFRLEFSKSCQKVITLEDLKSPTQEVTCELQHEQSVQPRMYWFGNVPLTVKHFQIISASS